MEIKINLEKKYVWTLGILILAVGLVWAYGGNNPQQMGHSAGEIEDMVVNCKDNDPICAGPKSVGWNLKAVAAWAANAWSAERLGGKLPSQYISTQCRIVSTTYTDEREHELWALCERNEALTGGGCTPSRTTGIRVTRPENSLLPGDTRLAWYCQFVDGGQAHAVCCKTG